MPLIFTQDVIRKLDRLELVARKQLQGQRRSQREVYKRGGSVEFADHRPYVAGDDLRYVDWNIYLRLGHLFLKQFEAEEDLELLILLDRSRSMAVSPGAVPGRSGSLPEPHAGAPASKLDYAKLLAGALGYVALATLDAVRLRPFDAQASRARAIYRGKPVAHAMLDEIENLKVGDVPTNLLAAVESAIPSGRGHGVAVLVSDFFAEEAHLDAALRRLRSRGWQPYVLHVVDADNHALSMGGRTVLIDAETGRRREIAVTRKLLASYATFLERREARFRSTCLRHEAGYVRVSTSDPFEEVILELLRRRGLVR